MHRAVLEVLEASAGLISRRDRRDLSHQIDHSAATGELVRMLPNVYRHRDVPPTWRLRVRAVHLWEPDAVIIGQAAGALTFWAESCAPDPSSPVGHCVKRRDFDQPRRYYRDRTPVTVEVAGRVSTVACPGITFTHRRIPTELITTRHGIRIADPALAAIDLAPSSGGDSIDDALRTRATTLDAMRRALSLTSNRRQNSDRRRLLFDSRSEPWSRGERLSHQHLYAANITGWRANVRIVCGSETFFQDIAFDDCPLVAEIDGALHSSTAQLGRDHRRRNLLVLHGKSVLNFTMPMVDDERLFVSSIQRALALFHR